MKADVKKRDKDDREETGTEIEKGKCTTEKN